MHSVDMKKSTVCGGIYRTCNKKGYLMHRVTDLFYLLVLFSLHLLQLFKIHLKHSVTVDLSSVHQLTCIHCKWYNLQVQQICDIFECAK